MHCNHHTSYTSRDLRYLILTATVILTFALTILVGCITVQPSDAGGYLIHLIKPFHFFGLMFSVTGFVISILMYFAHRAKIKYLDDVAYLYVEPLKSGGRQDK